ncbi:plasmid pRiA4b ORF-3 family protein [Komarekiella sp. 'clone 1']|uniref:Plasmid pRiA4b ORF-3 family protein n=1 Tax=Komarekiella delphini-convector SJRDD-AB1 TaxID=2593771 RepID=A0AA40SYC1_9NOST|nr:plasmid pRiA4b ORF-3 family protein [Komarekiella delphini-convector]MBD6617215.1 plasmid pRiA4b ORF-3 family protein [Komarekiella delphini-convector SJRDD-AB1]
MEDLFARLERTLNPELPSLTESQQQLLQELSINENQPGTIGRDFQTMIDFLQSNGVEVSSVNNLLPLKVLSEINSRLSHPIEHQLKRPVQKSYPYINGLYLLLRSSGIAKISSQGKKQILVLDEATLKSWSNLNSTERYFNLLEAWLIWGNNEILGEHQDPFGNLFRCIQFWPRIPEKGLKFAKYEDQQSISYYPGLHNVALLELFGLLSIKQGKPQAGKGWRIASLQRLPFGDALLRLLFPIGIRGELQDDVNVAFGKWQSHLQSFFPEWKQNLFVPTQGFTDGIYIFKVSVSRSWRRIAIPAKKPLSWLAEIILDAFDFDYDHLYEFSYKDRFGRTIKICHPYIETPPFADQVQIGDLPLEPGSKITYLYDFGDNWEFDVQLEAINPPDNKIKKAKILEIHGNAPQQYWSEDDELDGDEE